VTLALGVGSIFRAVRRWIANRHAVSSESQAHKENPQPRHPAASAGCLPFLWRRGDAKRKSTRAFARRACTTESWKKRRWGEDCASHSGLFYSAYPIPCGSLPPQHTKTVRVGRTSDARLQGGLNNFAPVGARTMAQKRSSDAQSRHPAASAGCLFFFMAQGRRETEARQGFRAAGLHHRALEDERLGQRAPLSRPPTLPLKRDYLRASGAWVRVGR